MDSLLGPVDGMASALTSAQSQRQSLAYSALSRGAALVQAKDYSRAIQEFRRAIAFEPDLTNAYRYMAQTYNLMNQPKEAIEVLKKALKVDPTNADARNDLATAYMTTKQWNEAEKAFLEVAKTNPGAAGPATSLGYIYLQTGRLAEADTQFDKVTRLAPTSSNAWYSMGLVRNKQGHFDEAVKLFQKAISLDSGNAAAYADLGQAYLGLEKPDLAKQQVNTLLGMGTDASYTLAVELQNDINTPKFYYFDSQKSNINTLLGPGTKLESLDASLATPGASKVFTVAFAFNTSMDVGSVTNVLNWTVSKATGGSAGVYNHGNNLHPETEAAVSAIPLAVTYDPVTRTAKVQFKVTQNADGNAVIDPSHLVFQFSGKDTQGRTMSGAGDQYDGWHILPF